MPAALFRPLAAMILPALAATGVASARPFPPRARAALAAFAKSAGGVLQAEKGTFRILVNGKEVGREHFEISSNGANWIARGTTEIASGKSTTRVTGTLTLRPDGAPAHYEWSTQGAKNASATINFNGPVATVHLLVGGGRTFTQQFTFSSGPIAILDNNMYDQYAVLAQLYDWNKKGAQNFSVLVPQELTPGTATVESMGPQNVDGKDLDELRVSTQDNEIDLYLKGSQLVRIAVPSANAEIIRE